MANPIEAFFAKQPFNHYAHRHGEGTFVMTDWFPISNPLLIPDLIKLGLEVDGLKVRKSIKLSDKWQISNTQS